MAGEILRAFLTREALIARPRWYVSDVANAAYVVGAEISGQIHIQANTLFQWTSFGFARHGIPIGGGYVDDFGETALVQFRAFESGEAFSNAPGPAILAQSYLSGQSELVEYPLLPGNFRLGWSLWPLAVEATDSYNLVFGGIEYVMPKSLADYGIAVTGG